MDQVKKYVHYWSEDMIKRKYTGKGIGVAVLDTGLSPHPDMKGRVVAFKDCINRKKEYYDDNGHGTHVAGILAGDGRMSKGVLAGMAPGAYLVVVKILDEKGEGAVDNIIEGLEWVRKNYRRLGIRIVNLSAGAKKGLDEKKELRLIEAVERLWNAGLVVVVSAGNNGPGEGTVVVPGTSRKVITVGAIKAGGKDEGCSGEGPTESCVVKPDVVAPGYQIISCNRITAEHPEPYTIKSGTSMATPVVSGAAALLLSKYQKMSNVEVKLRLRQTSKRVKMAGEQGWGCIQVDKFMENGIF